ncbi:hypothetical protein [Parashewanella tropica]|uniref:hypothetical protein n=1 Tax=Parashewanella tropica TaxID=2547970 RepID=UPI00105AA61D|nr:hypothetical protein [Parashewanella tropica]
MDGLFISKPSDQLSEAKLQAGDIILFEGEAGDTLNWLIMHLSNSKYTHSALVYEDGILADAALSGLNIHHFSQKESGRPACVMRLNGITDSEPLITNAATLVNKKLPYDKPGLILAGLLLLQKKFPLHRKAQKWASLLLQHAAKEISAAFAKGKHPVTCSQFVSSVYTMTGGDYALYFKNADILSSSDKDGLIHKCQKLLGTKIPTNLAYGIEVSSSLDEILSQLKDALNDTESVEEPVLPETVNAVKRFSCSLTRTLNSEDAIHKLAKGEELFITPGDLRQHCINLQFICDVHIVRDNAIA